MRRVLCGFVVGLIMSASSVSLAQEFDDSPLGAGGALPFEDEFGDSGAPQTTEEIQAQMEAEAEEQRIKLREEAFNAALRNLLPLTPEEIDKTLDSFKESREHAERPLSFPTPQVVVKTVSLDPGSEPPTLILTPDHVMTLNILDMTGAPWPIQDASWAGNFDFQQPGEGSHVLRIIPRSAHGISNLSIRLVGLVTPVVFSLKTGLDEGHYRFDARIPKMGPLANVPLISHGGLNMVAGDDVIVGVLDGMPPGDAVRMHVSGTDGRTSAWEYAGSVYLRTPLTLLSPAWHGSATSADGMNVYALNDVPVVLLSDNGKMVRAYIGMDME